MNSFLRWGLALVLAVLPATSLAAQGGGRLPFTVVGPEQGLPTGTIACIAQDKDGFLWMGTESGLLRHSAGQWKVWTARDGLPTDYVPEILATEEGLWIPSIRGLVRFKDGHADRALLEGVPATVGAGHLALDGRGRVWASIGTTLYVQQKGLAFTKEDWHPSAPPFALTAGPISGAVFIASPAGIHAIYPDGHSESWGPADGLPGEGPRLVIEDGKGRLWAGTGRTLVMKEPGASRFSDQSKVLNGSLTPASLPFLDRDGSVWLPTQNGIVHLMEGRAELIGPTEGLPFRWVRTIFRDSEGTLWVVGPDLARLEGGGRVRNYGVGDGTSGETVWWITRDGKHRLLIGTDDGAYRLGPTGFQTVPGTEGWRIKSLAEDHLGTLWMVNTIGPTLWLRPGQTRAEKAPLGDAGAFVNSVMEDSENEVWFGHTRLGLLRWDPATRHLIQEVAPSRFNLKDLSVFAVKEDARGRLWAGSSAGLLVRGGDSSWHLFTVHDGLEPHNVRGVAFLPDGSAWVHYQEPEGLTRVRVEDGRLTVVERRTKGNGLHSDLVYALGTDAEGHAWATTDRGMDRLDPPLHVGREDGMANEDCSVHALLVESDRIWVGTGAGLVRYDSAAVTPSNPAPEARILEITTGARTLQPPFALGTLSHVEGTVSFRVSSPTFVHERGLRIQIRLVGLEDTWHELEGHLARYASLSGGSYRFEARAAQGDGPFGPVAVVTFRVRPPWWLSGWALVIYGLACVAAVYGLIRLRVAAFARSKAELESEVASRTEELQARNTELTTALTQVKQLSGLLPICSCCKKIRDDRGYWNQIESYISSHSEADFTHGICPECTKEMFPDFASKRRTPPDGPLGPT